MGRVSDGEDAMIRWLRRRRQERRLTRLLAKPVQIHIDVAGTTLLREIRKAERRDGRA